MVSSPETKKDIDFIDLNRAAELFGVSTFTIKRYIKQNKVIGKRTPGGHWRVSKASCDSYFYGSGENK